MPFYSLDQRKLFIARHMARESARCSILLIHGAGGTHLDWPSEIRNLVGYDVYAIDLPGHGRSDYPGCSTILEYAGYIRAFIKNADDENLILVGHSMGGAIVQTIGLNPSHKVKGLVLVASGSKLRIAPEILEGVLPEFEKTVETIVNLAWSENASIELKEFGRKMMLKNDPLSMHGDFLACNDFNFMDRLDEIQPSTLIISGTEDRLTPPKYSQFLADSIPHSHLVTINGAGHMIMLEEPNTVSSFITDFVEELFPT
jgi:pimeloyl-ACP methyl ester carboxylesterase